MLGSTCYISYSQMGPFYASVYGHGTHGGIGSVSCEHVYIQQYMVGAGVIMSDYSIAFAHER